MIRSIISILKYESSGESEKNKICFLTDIIADNDIISDHF